MEQEAVQYLAKAHESLASAESDLAAGRYNSCANRCYYACFQAAVAALVRAGIRPVSDVWDHAFVQSEFAGRLIHRRKLFAARHRRTLNENLELRGIADYEARSITRGQARAMVRSTQSLVQAVASGGDAHA